MACSPKRTGHDEELRVRLPESVSRVLLELRIRFDLGLRNRHQDLVRRKDRLRVPGARSVLTEANQVLAALALRSELEETLIENRVTQLRLRESARNRFRRVEEIGRASCRERGWVV